ncbi:MAG TPA: hypothetical protein VF936_05480 [Burkholderiales bacterium]
MGFRAYWAFVLAVMLGTQYWIAEQFEWVGRGKARAVKAALGGSYHEARVPLSYIVDLPSGRGGLDGDLRWAMDTRDHPHLGPYRGSMLALAGNKAWEDIDARHLAGLAYSATSFPTGYESSPVGRGTVVAVRTAEGRLAKVRYVSTSKRWALDMQWVVYPPVGQPEPSPWLEWLRMREAARMAYRGRDYDGVVDACRKGIAWAEQAGAESPVLAQALIDCGSFLDLYRYAPRPVENWLLRGTELATKLGTERITGVLGGLERELYARGLRSLALLYREQRRGDEAARYFTAEADARRDAKARR